jgi:hypothetical protein
MGRDSNTFWREYIIVQGLRIATAEVAADTKSLSLAPSTIQQDNESPNIKVTHTQSFEISHPSLFPLNFSLQKIRNSAP